MATKINCKHLTRDIQVFVVDFALTATGLAALAGGIYSIFTENPAMAATCMGAGLILLFASTLHRFELLKGFGIEAKTRELNRTIDKAEVALSQLREITEVASEAIITISSKTGRWDSAPSVPDAYDLSRKIKRILAGVGSDNGTISKILEPWATAQSGDLTHALLGPLRKSLQAKLEDIHRQISELPPADHMEKPSHFVKLQQQQEAVARHLNMGALHTFKWPLSESSQRLADAITDAPELDDSTKKEMLRDIGPALRQLDFLSANLDLEDISFWQKQINR